jgi:hypothetical protein
MKRTQQEINAQLVRGAYVETVIEAGPLPERIEDMPAHTAKHYRLMRSHPGLNGLTDAEITTILNAQ